MKEFSGYKYKTIQFLLPSSQVRTSPNNHPDLEYLPKGDIDISLTHSQFLAKCVLTAKTDSSVHADIDRTDASSMACIP